MQTGLEIAFFFHYKCYLIYLYINYVFLIFIYFVASVERRSEGEAKVERGSFLA
jgi:hypothetical protein